MHLGSLLSQLMSKARLLAPAAPAPAPPAPAPPPPPMDLASRILRAMQRAGYAIAAGPDVLNIVYVEGMNPDGTGNDNAPNRFNDLRILIRVPDGRAAIAGIWEATTEPGRYWTEHPMNPKGAARVAFGAHACWTVGEHHGHEALIQVAPIPVFRDYFRHYRREGAVDVGLFGINQHWGYDLPRDDLGRSSAGCLVGRARDGHREFMRLVKSDRRYLADRKSFRFPTVILPASEV